MGPKQGRELKNTMWYYIHNNQRIGPVDENILRALIRNGTVARQTPVWKEGMQEWCQAGMTELQTQFASVPPAPPSYSGLGAYPTAALSYTPDSFKTLWLWFAWLAGLGLPLYLIWVGLLLLIARTTRVDYVLLLNWFGLVPLVTGLVVNYILLYRFWHVIQSGTARTSPGKAVGFCFIPFFNLYWLYVAIVGLAVDMNNYCNERNMQCPRVSEGLALIEYILVLITLVPGLGLITAIAGLVIWIILYKQFADTAARITEVRS
jgi:hypothetical protein